MIEPVKVNSTGGLHKDEVTGLGLDVLNRHLVSCSLDKTLKLWDFYRCKLLVTYTHSHPIDNLFYNR
jgi:WD40 repeat protein